MNEISVIASVAALALVALTASFIAIAKVADLREKLGDLSCRISTLSTLEQSFSNALREFRHQVSDNEILKAEVNAMDKDLAIITSTVDEMIKTLQKRDTYTEFKHKFVKKSKAFSENVRRSI